MTHMNLKENDMNTLIRNLVVGVPLATAALTMVPGAAQAADTFTPKTLTSSVVDPDPDPRPEPRPCPVPGGPLVGGDCRPGGGDEPGTPGDEPGDGDGGDEPGDGPGDNPGDGGDGPGDGPGDWTNPEPCPTHGECPDDNPGDGGDGPGDGGDGPGQGGEPGQPEDGGNPGDQGQGGPSTGTPGAGFVTPTRIDAGLAAASEEGGLSLSFVLVGGALVSATGAAFAARTRARRSA